MSDLQYTKPESLRLKSHPTLKEEWLHDRIIEDPSILGLGDLEVVAHERKQARAGRLDLLLYNREENARYEVELMLGATDESHIIRCIEYWDIERRKYPAYDHFPVLVAENITGRFLNVLGLFAGSIPLIAIQLSALKVGNQVVLDFVHVLNQTALREDDIAENKSAEVDRSYWSERTSTQLLQAIDESLEIINRTAEPKQKLNFNKHYIGLNDGIRSRNFVFFQPKKKFMYLNAVVPDAGSWKLRLEDSELESGSEKAGMVWIRLTPEEFKKHATTLSELLNAATANHLSE
jgi:hypothetical protein